MHRLDHIHEVRVTVVVVTNVRVIEPGESRPFMLGVERLVVPVGDHDLAIWVEARKHQVDDVIQDALGILVVPGGEIVGDLGAGLRARDLGRVKTVRLAEDDLASAHESIDFI